jgi:transcription initiation factor IIE alpha subunit
MGKTKTEVVEVAEIEAPKVADLTPKDLAERWGTDAKTVRRFIRTQTSDRANKGGRWAISSKAADELTAKFENRGAKKEFVPRDDEDVEELEELEDLQDEINDIDDAIG